ncbi:F-box domain-containing protein [Mycena sanguinolenta]|uniref:F-box domain-containing protein n=1 Tax=Mycena sanguinolenta TaxID=230812 RepID=A0A8H6X7E4_9AGAR|nr:F-box domain-containing protein [Mycena sanguinolenta]
MLAHAPFVLLKICRRWREIALTTPRLWATLDVNVVSLRNGLCPGSSSSSAEWTSLAAGWLSRSRDSPLSVTLRHPPEEEDLECDMFQPDFVFIRCIAHRLESLEVYGLAEGDESLDFTPGLFLLLQRLVIGPAVPGTYLEADSLAFFAGVPELRELVLSGRLPIPVSEISLPWKQLTAFSGHDFALDDFLDILRSAPDLERCDISLRFHGLHQPQSVTHPRLQYLTIFPDSDADNWPSYEILKFVTLPSLGTLDVSQIIGLTHDGLESFLSRSSAPLRQLAVAPDCEDDYSIWDIAFRLIPDLEDLRLHCRESIFQEGFLKAFSRSEDRLLPNLRRLVIRLPSSRHGDVCAALEERRKHEDKLSTAMMLLAPEDAALPSLNIRFV